MVAAMAWECVLAHSHAIAAPSIGRAGGLGLLRIHGRPPDQW